MPTVKSHKLDFEKVSLSDVKTNDIGGKSIYINLSYSFLTRFFDMYI